MERRRLVSNSTQPGSTESGYFFKTIVRLQQIMLHFPNSLFLQKHAPKTTFLRQIATDCDKLATD